MNFRDHQSSSFTREVTDCEDLAIKRQTANSKQQTLMGHTQLITHPKRHANKVRFIFKFNVIGLMLMLMLGNLYHLH